MYLFITHQLSSESDFGKCRMLWFWFSCTGLSHTTTPIPGPVRVFPSQAFTLWDNKADE